MRKINLPIHLNKSLSHSAVHSVSADNIKTIFEVEDAEYDGMTATNLGGISVDEKALFAVKSNSKEEVAVLYYYDNIYDTAYKNKTKKPLKIIFPDGILAHANAMAIDDSCLYIPMWGIIKTKANNKIMRIKRKYIPLVRDGAVVKQCHESGRYSVLLQSGETVEFCRACTVNYVDGQAYDCPITQIASYSYDSKTGITRFIIPGKLTALNQRDFTIATLKNNKITVDSDTDFTLRHSIPNDIITAQDIFYASGYGLYVIYWGYNGVTKKGSRMKNYVLRYNPDTLESRSGSRAVSLMPSGIIEISAPNAAYKSYELESLALIENDKNTGKPLFVFSCNNVGTDKNNRKTDSIDSILYNLKDAGAGNFYSVV